MRRENDRIGDGGEKGGGDVRLKIIRSEGKFTAKFIAYGNSQEDNLPQGRNFGGGIRRKREIIRTKTNEKEKSAAKIQFDKDLVMQLQPSERRKRNHVLFRKKKDDGGKRGKILFVRGSGDKGKEFRTSLRRKKGSERRGGKNIASAKTEIAPGAKKEKSACPQEGEGIEGKSQPGTGWGRDPAATLKVWRVEGKKRTGQRNLKKGKSGLV